MAFNWGIAIVSFVMFLLGFGLNELLHYLMGED